MKRPLDISAAVPLAFVRAAAIFRSDPAEWLPELSHRAEPDRWGLYLWAGEVGLHVDCTIGEPYPDGAPGVWRMIRWQPDTPRVGSSAPSFDGDVGIVQGPDGQAVLRLRGFYRPPGGLIGALADRLGLRRVAAATGRRLLADITAHLTAAPQEQHPPGPTG